MSEIMRGVLRMPPELWGDDPLSVAQRHQIYVEAADTIDRLQEQCISLRADAERYRWLRSDAAPPGKDCPMACMILSKNILLGVELDAAIDAAKGAK